MADRVVTFEVESYLTRLRVERGLAANTIVAYTRDLAAFVEFADRYGVSNVDDVDRRLIRRHIWPGSTLNVESETDGCPGS